MSNREPASSRRLGIRTTKVFYTIFTNEEMVQPQNPAVLDNKDNETSGIGCIFGSQIPPPHTVKALKRAICKAEKIADPDSYELYQTSADAEALDEMGKVNLASGAYPGAELGEPAVLVDRGLSQTAMGQRPPETPIRRVICGQEIRSTSVRLIDHTSAVLAVAFSPDGLKVASGSGHGIRLIDVASTSVSSTLKSRDDGMVTYVVFSRDGTRIASSSGISAHVWDVASGTLQHTFMSREWVSSVAFSPDGLRLAVAVDQKILIRELSSEDLLGVLKGHAAPVDAIMFSPDGSNLVSGSQDKSVRLWDADSMACTRVMRNHGESITSLTFSSDGSVIVSSSDDATVKIWDTMSGQLVSTLRYDTSVYSVAVSPAGSQAASGTSEGTIKIWDITSGITTLLLLGHTSPVHSMAFSPDGLTLASASADQTLRLWSLV